MTAAEWLWSLALLASYALFMWAVLDPVIRWLHARELQQQRGDPVFGVDWARPGAERIGVMVTDWRVVKPAAPTPDWCADYFAGLTPHDAASPVHWYEDADGYFTKVPPEVYRALTGPTYIDPNET